MKRSTIYLMAIAVVLSLGACNNAKKTEESKTPTEESHEGHDHEMMHHEADTVSMDSAAQAATLCGACGQIKGSEKCCVEGAEKCEKCTMDKGSPGCCKITADASLCSHCGEIAKSDACCKEDAKKCERCGLNAGSPGCCKI